MLSWGAQRWQSHIIRSRLNTDGWVQICITIVHITDKCLTQVVKWKKDVLVPKTMTLQRNALVTYFLLYFLSSRIWCIVPNTYVATCWSICFLKTKEIYWTVFKTSINLVAIKKAHLMINNLNIYKLNVKLLTLINVNWWQWFWLLYMTLLANCFNS